MSTNWKEYVSDPKFLIALLPGLEIARDNMNREIDSIRAAINAGKQPAPPVHELAEEPVKLLTIAKRKYVRKTKTVARPEGFVAEEGLTQTQFVLAVAKFHGGKATNAQLRAAAWKNRRAFGSLNNPKRLSVTVADAIKKGLVVRSGEGEVQVA
jgi:hypothetical protein